MTKKTWAQRCAERATRRADLAGRPTGGYGTPSRIARAVWAGERTLPELAEVQNARATR